MKKILLSAFSFLCLALLMAGCEKESNYPGALISPYIPLYDLRTLYKGDDLKLTEEVMFGSEKITGVVVSDFSEGNMVPGLLLIQDKRRLQQLRGIALPVGDAAADYVPGDSVVVDVVGGTLERVEGMLQITGLPANAIKKVSSGNPIALNRVPSSSILADPDKYESTLVAIVKGGFDPNPSPGDVLEGDVVINDGFENLTMHIEPDADFTGTKSPVLANYFGVVYSKPGADGALIPELRLRKGSDIQVLSSTVEITPVIISGFMADVKGGDGNYEYIQLLATADIDFSVTPYSVVTTNNAGATNPTGFPSLGWATGSLAKSGNSRTFKFDLTSGKAAKGTYFYVGGAAKMINGASSTSMAESNWVRAFNYTTTNGDGFGLKTSGLFANSGNASGIAVFKGTTVTKDTKPVDVIFVGAGGSLFSAALSQGYAITNTDWYDAVNPITLEAQPFYRQGSNTMNLIYNAADVGYFIKLGGVYNPAIGRWVKARTQSNVELTKSSPVSEIEGVYPAADENGEGGVPATTLK